MAPSKSVLWHICNIIQTEMGLKDGQVVIYNQKWDIPTTDGPFIAVGILTAKPIGNKSQFDNGIEYQSVNMSAIVSIDIKSRDTSALDRKEDLVMALGSNYSQRIQEQYGFKIGRLPATPVVNVSEVEGAAIPYRFNLSVQVQYQVSKQKSVDYYGTFNDTVTTEA